MNTQIKLLFLSLFITSSGAAHLLGVSPLLEYTFNADSTTQPSTGSITTSVTLEGVSTISADGSGVSGLSGDRAFVSGNSGMGSSQSVFSGVASGAVDLSALSSLTITGWFNATTVLTNSAVLFQTDDGQLGLRAASDGTNGTLRLVVNNTSSTRSTGSNTLYSSTNAWVFFALTWNGTTLKYYDGNSTTAVDQLGSDVAFSATMSNPAAGLTIAGNGASLSNEARPFAGSLDNLSLYSSVLSLSDLETVRTQNLSNIPEPSTSGLILGSLAIFLFGFRRRALNSCA